MRMIIRSITIRIIDENDSQMQLTYKIYLWGSDFRSSSISSWSPTMI